MPGQMQGRIVINLHILQLFTHLKSTFLKKKKKSIVLPGNLAANLVQGPLQRCTYLRVSVHELFPPAAAFTCQPPTLCNSLKHHNLHLLFLTKPNQTRGK